MLASASEDHRAISAPPASHRRWLALAILIWIVILFLNLGFLKRHSLSNNEFITLQVLDMDYGHIVAERLERNHMPQYFLFLKAWTRAFGRGEFALRFPSAVFALIGIFFIWRLGAHLYGERLGLLALALAGFNQIYIERGGDARMYSALMCAAAWAVWALVKLLDTGRRRYAVHLALAGLLGLGVQLLFLFVTCFSLLFVLVKRRALAGRIKPALVGLLAPLLCLTPLILWWGKVENKVGRSGWSKLQLTRALRQLVPMFAGDHNYLARDYTKFLASALVLVTVLIALYVWWTRRAKQRAASAAWPLDDPDRYLGFFLFWCIVPALLIALVGIKSDNQLVGSWRYYVTVAAVAPLVVLSAWRWLWGRGPLLARGYAAAMIFVLLAGSAAYLIYPGPGLREAALHIAAGWREGDRIVTSRKRNRSVAFEYYGHLTLDPDEKPPELDTPEDILTWLRQTSAGAKRLWVVYYDDQDSDFAKVLHAHAELLKPAEPLTQVGETGFQLFDVTASPTIK